MTRHPDTLPIACNQAMLWPGVAHVKLAMVTMASGDITSIVGMRDTAALSG